MLRESAVGCARGEPLAFHVALTLRRSGNGSGNSSCAGKEANGARMSRVAGVTSLIELTRGQARHRAELS